MKTKNMSNDDILHPSRPRSELTKLKQLWLQLSESEQISWREMYLSRTQPSEMREYVLNRFNLNLTYEQLQRFRRWLEERHTAQAIAAKMSQTILPHPELTPAAPAGFVKPQLQPTQQYFTGLSRDDPELSNLVLLWHLMSKTDHLIWYSVFSLKVPLRTFRPLIQHALGVRLHTDAQLLRFMRWTLVFDDSTHLRNN